MPNTQKASHRGSVASSGKRFIHVAISKQSRDGLNKLVTVLAVDGQRAVLERLIADELHRLNLRLPRVS